MKNCIVILVLLVFVNEAKTQQGKTPKIKNNWQKPKTPFTKSRNLAAYLFVYFTGTGNNQEAIRFALSNDGYHFKALNKNNPVIEPAMSAQPGGYATRTSRVLKIGRRFIWSLLI